MQGPSQFTIRLSSSDRAKHRGGRLPLGARASSPASIRALIVKALLLIATFGAFGFTGFAYAQTDSKPSALKDDNPVTPGDIVRNYRKRYPYAKSFGDSDQVTRGESAAGSEKSYQAYRQVRRKCTDGLGTMDQKPCDTDGAPLYCAEECIPDECPPYGKHCPVTPHYNWAQDQETANVTPPTQRDGDSLDTGKVDTKGLPMSDAMYQVVDRNNKQRLLEMMFDPERTMWTQTTVGNMQMSSMANSMGGAAEASFNSAFATIRSQLINVANERATGAPQGGSGSGNSIEEAVYVVQRLYKEVFLPLAVLFLLPGAVLTQVKGLIGRSITGGDEDSINPFTGIIRAIIAIFLIPCTQLIISYCIDIGNTLAFEVARPDRGWIQESALTNWAKEQTFNPRPTNVNNGILPPGQGRTTSEGRRQTNGARPAANQTTSGSTNQGSPGGSGYPGSSGPLDLGSFFGVPAGTNSVVDAFKAFFNFLFGDQYQDAIDDADQGGEGKASGQLESKVIQEDQKYLSTIMQVGFNGASLAMGSALNILVAYQLVFMCYLFLMGPIAACFYAWPSGVGSLFKKVFSNWLDAVVVLSLWRFWWCAILAVMTQRIVYLQPNPGSPSEMMVYSCFLALLLYIPFQPFDFRPGPMVSRVLEKAGGGGAGGGGGGKGGSAPGASADDTGSDSKGSRTATTRSDASAGRDLPTISSGSRGPGPGSQSSRSSQNLAPAAALSTSEPPSSSKSTGPAGDTQAPPPGSPSVAGRSVAMEPPPNQSVSAVQSKGSSPAVDAARSQAGSQDRVAAVSPDTPPTVPLTPSAGGATMLVNTANPALAAEGAKSWQTAPSSANTQGPPSAAPASGLDLSGANRTGASTGGNAGNASAAPAFAAAPASQAPTSTPSSTASPQQSSVSSIPGSAEPLASGSTQAPALDSMQSSVPAPTQGSQSDLLTSSPSAPPISSVPATGANLGTSPPPGESPRSQ